MRKLIAAIIVTTMVLGTGFVAWNAEAKIGAGAAQLSAATKSLNPVVPAACGGVTGAHCPAGYYWNGNRCLPC